MKYLFSVWNDAAARLRAAAHRLFLFDVDGTLASIEKIPQAARVHERVRRLLYQLSNRPRTTVGIISGRRLDDAKKMVRLPQLIYAGNHGIEVCFDGSRQVQSQARRHAAALEVIHKKAEKGFSAVPGALVESKGFTMSLHYRMVSAKNRPRFNQIVRGLAPLIRNGGFQTRKGKKVIEILPSGSSNKGTVVKMLMRRFREPVTVFVGDDATDETAFDALSRQHLSVRVGHKNKSKARYYLKSQREVNDLLRRLVKL